MRKLLNKSSLIYAILALAFILRIVNINQSLWLDEAIGAYVVRDNGTFWIASKFPLGDFHPPLYYIFLDLWTQIFGYSDVALRIPSVVFSLLSIYLVYKLLKDFYKNIPAANIAALCLATSPLHVYYSQEARMYMMVLFFAVACFYMLEKYFVKKSNYDALLFSVFFTMMIFTDYVPLFLAPAYALCILYKNGKKVMSSFKDIFVLFSLPALMFLFWSKVFIIQLNSARWLSNYLPAWSMLSGEANIKQLLLLWTKLLIGRISFENYLVYGLYIFGITVTVAYPIYKTLTKKYLRLMIWFMVPILSSFSASFLNAHFSYFRLIFVLPAIYAVLGLALNKLKSWKYFFILLLIFNIIGLGKYYLQPKFQRENWKGAIKYIESNYRGDFVLFSNTESFAPVKWYGRDQVYYGASDSIKAGKDGTFMKVKDILSNYDNNSVLYFDYLKDLHDPNGFVIDAIRNSGFTNEIVVGDFENVGFIRLFSKI